MNPKSIAKSKPKVMPVFKGSSGDWVEANVWFKIGLGRSEAAMLRKIMVRIFGGRPTSADVARELLRAALAHYDEVEPLMLQDARYAESEGFRLDKYLKGLIKHQHAALLKLKPARKSRRN